VTKTRCFLLFAVFVLNTCAWVALTAPPQAQPLASQAPTGWDDPRQAVVADNASLTPASR
jgi:hypothetical protein